MGAAIGFQKERADKPAGLRTHILISVGAALFTIASIYGFGVGADPSWIAAGIVAGIGFLGAGAIIRRGKDIVEGFNHSRYYMGSSCHWSDHRCWFILGLSGYYCHRVDYIVSPPPYSMRASPELIFLISPKKGRIY